MVVEPSDQESLIKNVTLYRRRGVINCRLKIFLIKKGLRDVRLDKAPAIILAFTDGILFCLELTVNRKKIRIYVAEYFDINKLTADFYFAQDKQCS